MTWEISTSGAVVTNTTERSGAPALRITGDDVTFTNALDGRLTSTAAGVAAVVLDGFRTTLTNHGVIENGASKPALDGSADSDVIVNFGSILGDVRLGAGHDSFIQWSADAGAVDLGAGDDVYRFQRTGIGPFLVQPVEGGDGWDRMIVTGPLYRVWGTAVTGFEDLEVLPDAFNLEYFSGYKNIFFHEGGFNNFLYSVNPDADLKPLDAHVTVNYGSVFRSVIGGDSADAVVVAAGGTVLGGIALADGDDYVGLDWAGNAPSGTVGGTIDGGGGNDVLQMFIYDDATIDPTPYLGFEQIVVFNLGDEPASVALSNVDGADMIYNVNAQNFTLALSNSPGAIVRIGYPTNLVLESTVTVLKVGLGPGDYPYHPPEDNLVGNPAYSSSVINNGTVLGDVRLFIGNDLYDGRLGTAGGTVFTYAGNDTLRGGAGDDRLDGGFGVDSMSGGGGNDTYYVDNAGDMVTEQAIAGTDTVQSSVNFTLGANVENLVLTGTGAVSGTGNDLANLLTGNGAANRLDGRGGADTMSGGQGNDSYVVDNAGDLVQEEATAGSDTVSASIAYSLTDHVETLILSGAGHIAGTGNGAANTIVGNAGNNRLDGGAESDVMKGGAGNDTYVVDNAGDQVQEASGQGTDLVLASVSHSLAFAVENLTLTGTASIDGNGNSASNLILGNSGDNVLNGMGAADVMKGGAGNDTYYVDNAGDVASEAFNQGTDAVFASVSYVLGGEVESLTLTGLGSNSGTGNYGFNQLTGNAGANVLSGLGGADSIDGGAGNDSLYGGTGHDSLTGGAGRDGFYFDSPVGAGNADDILDFSVADDTIYLDDAMFTGIAPGPLAASAFVVGTAAADAGDRIIHNQATGQIYYDSDGAGGAGAVLFATVAPATVLTSADFIAY